jgi:gliding motility-associated-like protein
MIVKTILSDTKSRTMSRKVLSRISISLLFICFAFAPATAQVFCPTNIGFESGALSPWVCLSGIHSGGKKNALAVTTALPTRHTITNGSAVDYYGGFPIVDPISGLYSAKIGNDSVNKQMDALQYKFKVPTGLNNYSLVYRYAVVFEDPVHTAADQPYFEVRVTDSATGNTITCASFIYVSSGTLPGFVQSDSFGRFGNSVVYYKPWSTASLNLSGHGGKTLIVEFIAADCALGAHMGYGYLDVGCGLFAISTATCNASTPMTAPPGFMKYKWYSSNYTLIDSGQSINVPTPTSLTTYHVILTPYPGYGCVDTLHTSIQGSILSVNAGRDTMMCNNTSVPLNATPNGNTPPYTYSWSPSTALSCTSCKSPIASPTATTDYVVTITDSIGCSRKDTVRVVATPDLTITTSSTYCSPMGTATAAVAYGTAPFTYSWNTTPPRTTQTITGLAAGTYAVVVTDSKGCIGRDTAIVVQAPAITPSITGTTSSCSGTGSITVTATGGKPSYTYALDSGAYSTTNSFTSLNPGTYTVHIKDSIGCVKDTIVTIVNTGGLSLSATVTNVSCNGGANGSITLVGSGGKTPYQFKLGSGVYGTASSFTGLTAGTYSVSIRDSNNCVNQINAVVVSQSSLIVVSTTKTNVLCNGDLTGTVAISATGGNSPFTYSLNGGAYGASNTYSTLAAGTYPILVKDSLGCIQSSSVTLTQPTKLGLSYTAVTPACNGALTGYITIAGSGGATPYQFALGASSFGTSGAFTNLAAGTYVLHIKDANNCTKDSTITIAQPTALTVTATATQVSCYGGNTGAVTVTAAGGTTPYTYAVGAGTYSSTATFSSLIAGTYIFHSKDANGCIKDTTIVISQPAALAISTAATQPSCNGVANGTIAISGSGGTTPYQYSLNTSAFSSTSSFSGLTAGTYALHIKDANNCQKDTTITIGQPTALNLSYTAAALLCNGNTTTVAMVGTGGTSPYQYSINAGTFSSTASYSGITAGTYILHLKDANNCTKDSSITITQPSVLTSSVNVTNVLCNGGTNGSVTVMGAGGTPGYTYAINTGVYGVTSIFGSLTAGTYTLHLKDANGCIKDTTITITHPSALTVSASATNPTCSATPNGSASITGSGGIAPYQYSLNGGTYGASGSFSGLSAGSHLLRVRDANNCTKDTTVTLIQPNAPSVSLSVTNILCNGNATGAATVTATGGTPAYAYALNTGAFGSALSFTGLAAGTYVIHTRDINNCQRDTTFTITQPTKLTLGYTATMPLCNGGTGSVTIAGAGGTSPYQYAVNAGAFSSTTLYSGLTAGTYVLHVTDANSCSKDSTIVITQPTALAVAAVVTNVLCNGGSTGTATVSATGGTPGYTYALNTGTYGSSPAFTNLGAGTYTLHTKDANGCIKDTFITLTQPSALTVSASSINPTCSSTPNGSASISGSGGVAPYQYSFNNGAYGTTGSFSGLSAGSYLLRVKDANNCTKDTTVTLIQPNAPSVSVAVTNVLCNGNTTGAAILTASGGTPAYSYAINGGAFGSAASFTNLAAGFYTISTKDVNNCQKDTSFTITQPTKLGLGYTATTPLCAGGNGTITVAGTGGTTPYQYAINTGTFSATTLYTGITAGTYVLHVKDANNCIKDSAITITQPTQVAAAVTVSNVLCNGGSNGSVSVIVTGGTPGYTYAINTGSYGNSAVLSGLTSGTYIVHIKDANGCIKDTTVTITQPSVLTVTGSGTNPTCSATPNGAATIIGAGGTSPYQYSLNGGTYGTSGSFTGLSAGSHLLRVRDANNCTKDTTIVLIQPNAPSVSLSVTAILCNGGSNGAVTVTGTGGTPAYTYSINSGSFGSTSTFSSLSAGTYTVHTTDVNNCQKDTTFTLAQPSKVNLGYTVATPLCNGGNGSVTIVGQGGTSPYQYAVNTNSYSSTALQSGLPAGTYVLHVQDANNCIKDSTITISQPTAVSVAVSVSNVSCNAGSNGSVTVAAAGGTAGYTYAINSGAYGSSNILTGLTAGTHIVHVKDANGCIKDTTITISQPTALSLGYFATMPLCNGGSNGSVTISGTGGVSPYQYALNAGTYTTTAAFTSLGANTYTLRVKDANGCTKDSVITISQPSAPTVSLALSNVLCNGGATGTATATAAGGTAGYTYAIGSGAFGSSASFTGLIAGLHTIHIKDANGCQKDTTFTISQPAVVNLTYTSTQPLCGGSNGTITISGAGGTSPYQYSVNSTSFTGTALFTGLTANTYVLHVRDANNCIKDSTVILTQPASVNLTLGITNVQCYGAQTGAVSINASGGTPGYTYAVNTGLFGTSSSLSGLSAGTHILHIKDANGCQKDTTITITQPAKLVISPVSTQPLCYGATNGTISVTGAGGATPYTYALNTGAFGTATSYSALGAGTFTVHIKDANGCTHDSTIVIGQPSAITVALAVTNVLCNGGATGTATITAIGGTPSYTYALGAGAYATAPSFTALASGTHTIHIRDANGCQKDSTFTITQPSALNIGYTSTQPLCGSPNGTITISGSGGTSPYQYSMNSGSFGSASLYNGLAAGTYVLHIKDANNCIKDSTIVLAQPASVDVTAAVTDVLCYGALTGSVSVGASGGTPGYTYAVNAGSFGSGSVLSGLPAGVHIVHVKDANGCQKDTAITITQPTKVVVNFTSNQPLCNGANNGYVTASGAGGVSPYTYALNAGTFGTATTFNGLGAGTVTLHIKDANGCAGDTTFTISQSPPLTAGLAVSNVLCYGGTSGAATAIGIGGTPSYTYALNAGSFGSASSFTGLSVGTYTVHVQDQNGCQKDTTFNITQPTVLGLGYTATQPLCSQAANGSVTISGNGGTSPYQYSINSGAFTTSGVFSGLAAGTYVLHTKDANNCTKDSTIIIVQPVSVSVAITSTPTSCFGGSNGSATATGAGGASPYTYAVDAGTYGSSNTLGGLTAGTHSVHVRDANGCQKDTTITIAQPTQVSLTYSSTQPLCFRAGNGTVTTTGVGGIAPYTFAVNSGTFGTASSFSGLSAGTNVLHVKDANGCTMDSSITLIQPTQVIIAPTVSNVLCYGGTTGVINVSGSGGTPGYTYAIGSGVFGSSGTMSGLAAGVYTVHIKDANGCIKDSTVTVGQPSVLSLGFVATQPSCFGMSNGSLSVNGIGGTSPYQYALNAGSFGSASSFNGLAANTYVLHVKDNNGCSKDSIVTVTQPAPLTATATHTDVTCYGGSNGTATVVGAGGTTPYSYSWRGTGQSVATATGLSAGTFTGIVTDMRGCKDSASVVITEPTKIVMSFNTLSPLCVGASTGAITANVTGGRTPYAYSWNTAPIQTAATILQIPGGMYTLTLTDASGCVRKDSVFVSEPLPVQISIKSTQVSCYGYLDGTAVAVASNGIGAYTYRWNTLPAQTNDSAANLGAGTYVVTATSAAGCKVTDSVTITQPGKLIVATVGQATCPGLAQGSISSSAIGGTAPYKYAWSTTPVQNTSTATGLLRGSYALVVTDANGCTDASITRIDSLKGPIVDAGPNKKVCEGSGVNLTPSGAVSYEWAPSGSLSCLSCTSPIAVPLTRSVYSVTGTDINGCKGSDTVGVEVIGHDPVFVDPKQTICEGDSVRLNAWGGISWAWMAPANSSAGARPMVAPKVTTTYYVAIQENECFTDTLSQEVEVLPTPSVDLGDDIEAGIGETVTINADAQNASTIDWTPGENLSCYTCFNPQHMVRGQATYIATVRNELGCAARDTIVIRGTCDDRFFFLANVFTPNGDGNNDRFYPQGAGDLNVEHFMIYDRWGEIVFSANNVNLNNPMAGWDGTFKNQPLKPDVYVYVMDAQCGNGKRVLKRGDVTLIR